MVDLTSFEPRPTREDNWLGWSRAGQQPRGDQGGEIAGKAIGSALENVGKIGGDITKAYAKSGAEDILNEDTARLEGIAGSLGIDQGSLLGTRGQADDPNKAPQEVMNAGTTIENLQSSKANGAMSNTYMDARILQFQKDTRSKFPFFRAQFDEGVREATGVAHTANEYHQKLLGDINSFLTGKDKYKDMALTEIKSRMGGSVAGVTADVAMARVHSGEWTPDQGLQWSNKVQANEWQHTQNMNSLNEEKAVRENYSERAVPIAQNRVNAAVNELQMAAAESVGLKTTQDMLDYLAHPEQHTPQEYQKVAQAYGALHPKISREIDTRLYGPVKDSKGNIVNGPDGKPLPALASHLKPEEIQKIRTSALQQFKDGESFITQGDFGGLSYWNRSMHIAETSMRYDLDKSSAGNYVRMAKTLKDMGADQLLAEYQKQRLSSGIIPELSSALDSIMLKSYFPDQQSLSQSSPGAKISFLQADINEMKKRYGSTPDALKVLLQDIPKVIGDPSVPDSVKIGKIQHTFDPRNVNVLNTWTRDDRPTAFRTMVSEPVVTAIKALSDKHPELHLWEEMKSNATIQARNLIGEDVRDLSKSQFNETRDQITYDNEHYRFKYNPPPAQGPEEERAQSAIHRMLGRINTTMQGIAAIGKTDESDPNVYILQSLRDLGYDPRGRAASIFPEALSNAIRKTYGTEESKRNKGLEKLRDAMKPETK